MDFMRKKIRVGGIAGLLNFSNQLKVLLFKNLTQATDPHKTHVINGFRLKQIIPYLTDEQIKRIVEDFNPTPNAEINYAQLIYALRGAIENER